MSKIKELYENVTNRIIAELEQGVRPWAKPWNAEHAAGRITRPLRHNGIGYNGINVLMLWWSAQDRGFISPYWLTFRQAKELGAFVRKGEKGSPVVYANTVSKTEQNDAGEDVEVNVPFMKAYTVFNADQIDGLPEHYTQLAKPVIDPVQRIDRIETFFENTRADIRTGGGQAYYAVGGDYIQMPPFEAFKSAESYYATLGHETTHWTRHPSRLGRSFGREKWGDAGYAREELVAEIGAAFLCADLDIEPSIREDHAPYIANWLKVLENDHRAIFTAAAHAQRAADFLHGLQDPAGQAERKEDSDDDEDRAAA